MILYNNHNQRQGNDNRLIDEESSCKAFGAAIISLQSHVVPYWKGSRNEIDTTAMLIDCTFCKIVQNQAHHTHQSARCHISSYET
ncbi:hypothetical protein FisN_28Lu123 [Fistulifera solaris]|uniref:Uncharacterized protein n=1 Tax=Fistulifera solaris TaxID=1519565 RepID=A0A1Z5K5A9_FISSO|nr:hypothetical protein FisN_28Lu123 [Fistulifera solaris]|eukprot:GAX21399.1 hypothetical protein FisN_28Lu123 [Fistulifera solaris]